MSVDMLLNLLIIACGAYMMYQAVRMKKTKKIPDMLVSKGFPIEKAHDAGGFIQAVFPMTYFTGTALSLAGAVSAFKLLASYPFADAVINLLEVAAILLYGVLLMKAQRKYLVGE